MAAAAVRCDRCLEKLLYGFYKNIYFFFPRQNDEIYRPRSENRSRSPPPLALVRSTPPTSSYSFFNPAAATVSQKRFDRSFEFSTSWCYFHPAVQQTNVTNTDVLLLLCVMFTTLGVREIDLISPSIQ